jgi:hypothetical protein
MVTVFWYYRFLLGRLPKPHLLSRQVKELLGAPPEDSSEGLRDRLAIALLTGTGITERELERLTFADLHQQMQDGKSALTVKEYRRCPGRIVPYYIDRIDDAPPRINYAQEVAAILEKFDEQKAVQSDSAKNEKKEDRWKKKSEVWWRKEQGRLGQDQIAVRLDEPVFGELPRFRWLFKTVKTVALFVEKLPLFWSQLRDWMLLGLPVSWSWLRQEVCGRTWAVDRLLIKYPIMIDGMVRVVGAEELRRTYARRLYESEKNLEVLQRYLGCQDVEDVLGYVGPILARIEKRHG